MKNFYTFDRFENFIIPKLMRIPVLNFYAKTRGWPYVLAWAHRISGVLLVLYLWFHIYTLSLLQTPDVFENKMRLLRLFLFVLLEWALALPVAFHALNGGRLILYEIFGNRKDIQAICWVLGLSCLYAMLLGFLMLLGSQKVTPVFFWFCALISGFCVCYLVVARIRQTQNTLSWKLQRITGGFLLIMIPAHLLFMHLNHSAGHDADLILNRMQNIFIKTIDILLVLSTLYHGGYGLLSIAKDYLASDAIRSVFSLVVFLVMTGFAWIGIKLAFGA